MKNSTKQSLLEEIERDSSTIGIQIPDTVRVQGTDIPLNNIVCEIGSEDDSLDGFDIDVQELKKNLRRKRNELVETIESGEVKSERDARNRVHKIKQIDKSLEMLDGSDSSNITSEIEKSDALKKKRWMDFLDKIRNSN